MADNTHTTTIVLNVNDDNARRKIKERTADLDAMRKRLNEIAAKPVSTGVTQAHSPSHHLPPAP